MAPVFDFCQVLDFSCRIWYTIGESTKCGRNENESYRYRCRL